MKSSLMCVASNLEQSLDFSHFHNPLVSVRESRIDAELRDEDC